MSAAAKKPKGGAGGPGAGSSAMVPRNLIVLTRFKKRTATILSVWKASGPPRKGKLLPVRLTDLTCDNYPIGTNEIVVAFHDKNGGHLASWGQSGRAKAFADVSDGSDRRARIEGGLVEPSVDDRTIHLAVPKGAVYLAFYRSEVMPFAPRDDRDRDVIDDGRGPIPGGKHMLDVTLLGFFYMFWDEDPRPPDGDLEVPWTILDLKEMRRADAILNNILKLDQDHPSFPPPGGVILNHDRIHGDGNVDTNFNVVIVGDGFAAGADQQRFQDQCELVKKALENKSPFDNYFGNTNIFVVNTQSNDSGISDYPDIGVQKSTYYYVGGHYGGSSYAGFVGTHYAHLIKNVTTPFGEWNKLDVILVIANCPLYGGSAFIHKKIVFATLCDLRSNGSGLPISEAEEMFKNVCLHEMAHDLGRLGEEYLPYGSSPYDPLEPDLFKNIVHRSEMQNAPWKEIATSSEWDATNGRFTHVRDCWRDPGNCSHNHNCIPVGAPSPYPELGLYWGAQYNDVSINTSMYDHSPCGWRSSAQGKDFFRAMAVCKMQHPKWDFCRWCAHVLSREIEDAI